MIRTPLLFFASFIIVSSSLYSDTINIPADYPTIQEGIDAAVSGDIVLVAPGTYVENIDFLGKAITVKSDQGNAVTVIDGSQNGSVVSIQGGARRDTVLEGFTLTNGKGNFFEYYPGYMRYCGGGVFCNGSSPTIMNNTITDNLADLGGGIYCGDYATPMISNNTISENNVFQFGGGIFCWYSSPTITKNIISRNSIYANGNNGGGICCQNDSFPDISYNTITENTASYRGGGISCYIYCDPNITNNIISGNSSGHSAGGVNCYKCSPNITNNIITDNSTVYWGGGIYLSTAHPDIFNNLISGNSAELGGGIICRKSSPKIINNTVSKNTADEGGGIDIQDAAVVTIANTITWDNSAAEGPEIWLGAYYPSTPQLNISYSDVKGGLASVYVQPGSILNWGAGMIDSDPLFVDFADGDHHLTWNSPCRDSGTIGPVSEPEDFEGDPRIAFGTVDIGADEFYTHLYITGDQTPGGDIQGKFVGVPGTSPVRLFIGLGGIRPTPLPTIYGDLWLLPRRLSIPLVPIPADGILVISTTIPSSPSAPYDVPMQALIGLDPDSLTNLCVLEVR